MGARCEKILYMSEHSLNVTRAGMGSQCRFRIAGVNQIRNLIHNQWCHTLQWFVVQQQHH